MASRTPIHVSVPRDGIVTTEIIHSPGFAMDVRVDEHHEIFHVVRGGVDIERGQEVYRVEPGDHAVVPSGTPHRLSDFRPATLFRLAIGPGVMEDDRDLGELWRCIAGRAPVYRRPGSSGRTLTTLWRTLLALERSDAGWRRRVQKRIAVAQLLLHLASGESDERQQTSRARVRAFRKHLAATAHETWTVDRAARACGVSVRRFSGLYREVHGTTLVRDLQAIRIDHVCALLRDGSHSVAGSAYSAGFEDLSHFYRVFNARMGMAPGVWLERERGQKGL